MNAFSGVADSSGDLVEVVRDLIREHGLETVIVGGSDVNGSFRGKRLPAERFCAHPTAPIRFADYMLVIDPAQAIIPPPSGFDGWWPNWSEGFGDIEAVPDLATFRVASWLPRTGVVLCDFRHRDGTPLAYSARLVLQRVVDIARQRGFIARMGPELEFYLLRDRPATGVPSLRPASEAPAVYGVLRGTIDHHLVEPLCRHLKHSRIDVEGWAPEGGAGQYEINLSHAEVVEAADRAFLFRQAVREFMAGQGAVATFMAKPFPMDFGSSFHVHQSLWSDTDESSLFYDATAVDGMSQYAHCYIGGVLATLAEFTCLFAPTVNSYKRLVIHSAAGNTSTWGKENRTASIRVVFGGYGDRRIELRTAGADANPYLVLAGALAGGLYGIQQGLDLPPESTGDAYLDASAALPGSLTESADRLAASSVAAEYFGADFVQYYAHTRLWEARQFGTTVTEWEIARYLDPP